MRIATSQFNINFSSDQVITDDLTAGEFFAGGGGWTSGLEEVEGISTKWILNHDKVALKTNIFHHKNVKVYHADVYVQDEHEMEYVDYVHASVECTQHSNANSSKKKKLGSYTMGWELYRYLKFLLPLVISIENVPEFKKWAPVDKDGEPIEERIGEEFERWKQAVIDLGYEYKESIRNAADDGLPTSRTRFFCFFSRAEIDIVFPELTHNKSGTKGKKKWEACRPHIRTENMGRSIFGRQFDKTLPKNLQKPLVPNSLKRIAGGIKKYYPELHQFLAAYHGGDNQNRFSSLLSPMAAADTSNRHQLVTIEKLNFIMDHCHMDNYNLLDEPLNPQLTWQTKQIIDVDFSQFIVSYYGSGLQTKTLDDPLDPVTTKDRHQIVRVEKLQFLVMYFGSNGNPGRNVGSLDEPLTPITVEPKHQLITLLDEFDILARFLDPDELGDCSTFPKNYFTAPGLKLSKKDAVRLIGNAVPPKWAVKLVSPNIEAIKKYKQRMSA